MAHLITAMYKTRGEAEAVQNTLRTLGIIKDEDDSANRGSVYDRTAPDYRAGSYATAADRGAWSDGGWDDDYRLPDVDRHDYEEGVHRGNTLLKVTVDDEMAQRAREVIDESDPVDIDSESEGWRNDGWTPPTVDQDDSARYFDRSQNDGSNRYRTYSRGEDDAGNEPGESRYRASGLANEAAGNVKQATGKVFGDDSLRQSGEAQERKGEAQQHKGDRLGDQGNEF